MRSLPPIALLAALAPVLVAACGNGGKLDPAKCDALRGKAFSALNGAPTCGSDKDCMLSKWPGCAKSTNQTITDSVKPIRDEWEKGGCQEDQKVAACPPPPEGSWCNQGVCEDKQKARNGSGP